MYIFGIHQIIYTALTNNRKNIVTENLKNLKILPFYRLCTKAWPKTRKLWVNPKNCDRRKKASSIRFTKHCVKSVQIQSFFWSVFSCIQSEYRKIRIRKNSIFGHFTQWLFLKLPCLKWQSEIKSTLLKGTLFLLTAFLLACFYRLYLLRHKKNIEYWKQKL